MSKTKSYRVIPTDEFLAILASNNASATNPMATMADIVSGSTYITVEPNYSALPPANTVTGKFYWVENSQGTAWLPGSLGGTYYPKGLYYSNGISWIVTDAPYQASQVEVGTEVGDGGVENTKFVTSKTLYEKGYSKIVIIAQEVIPAHRVVILGSPSGAYLFDPANSSHYGKVVGISYNSANIGDQITIITDDIVTFGLILVDGDVYYGGGLGVLTNIPPTTGIVQPVGIATIGSRFNVHIGTPILKA